MLEGGIILLGTAAITLIVALFLLSKCRQLGMDPKAEGLAVFHGVLTVLLLITVVILVAVGVYDIETALKCK